MCGIAGFWRFHDKRPDECARLVRMAAMLRHRGPDDFGYLFANSESGEVCLTQAHQCGFTPNVLLANRRLAITDLSEAGRQPLANDDNDVFVVFNGALHNYPELREELSRLGHRFRSRSDTEVLLRAYEQWGPDCVTRFNGMWAFAIWDSRHRRIVCSRDRFGIKPLFIARTGGTFYFASEAKSLLINDDISREPNLSYVKHFFGAGTPLEGRHTPFSEIEQLPPGHSLIVTEKSVAEAPYWRYDDQGESYDYRNPAETFRELFSDAVKIRLRGDVASALLLSGGLDSSSIAVTAAEHAPGAIEAYTARFAGTPSDESQYSEVAARHAHIPVTMVDYQARELISDLSRVTWHMDGPVAKGQILARWALIQTASRGGAKILLEGQGADEMLAGYPRRYADAYLRSELENLHWNSLAATVRRLLSAQASAENRQAWKQFFGGNRNRGSRDSGALFSSRVKAAAPYEADLPGAKPPVLGDRLTRVLWRDHARSILPYLLHFGDAISMGHSMESRLPFLDHRLVEFVFALPFQAKMNGVKSKFILRQALGEALHAETLSRTRKFGFSTPVATWLRPILSSEIAPALTASRFHQREIFDPRAIETRLAAFEAHGQGAPFMFRCLALEMWFRLFVDGEGFRTAV